MVKSNKIQKKVFFDVNSSLTNSKISLYAASAQELDGKFVRIDLTRSLRGKSLELKLKVKAEGEVLNSDPVSLELAGSFVRRMMRKGADYVEDSFVTESKDGKILIKPFLIARNKVSRAVRRNMRNTTKEHLIAHIKTRDSKELFNEIMNNKIQKELSFKLKKIYPLALCEIRMLEIVPEAKGPQVKVAKAETNLEEVAAAAAEKKAAKKSKVETKE
ncbi:MAG: hypothetical protein WCK29_03925 [archaeon]